MREIKFRAWNKRDKQWANINQLTDWDSCEMTACVGMGNEKYPYQTMRIESDAIYELMQYTGLKDKNGKEIYEGDVLKDSHGNTSLVNDPILGKWVYIHHHECGMVDEMEVIGNIYENPELLQHD